MFLVSTPIKPVWKLCEFTLVPGQYPSKAWVDTLWIHPCSRPVSQQSLSGHFVYLLLFHVSTPTNPEWKLYEPTLVPGQYSNKAWGDTLWIHYYSRPVPQQSLSGHLVNPLLFQVITQAKPKWKLCESTYVPGQYPNKAWVDTLWIQSCSRSFPTQSLSGNFVIPL